MSLSHVNGRGMACLSDASRVRGNHGIKVLGIPLAYRGAGVVQYRDDDGDSEYRNGRVPIAEQIDLLLQQEADTAAAHEADDRGHTHVDVPAVHGEGDVWRDDLRHNGAHDGLQAVRARALQRFDGTRIDALNML